VSGFPVSVRRCVLRLRTQLVSRALPQIRFSHRFVSLPASALHLYIDFYCLVSCSIIFFCAGFGSEPRLWSDFEFFYSWASVFAHKARSLVDLSVFSFHRPRLFLPVIFASSRQSVLVISCVISILCSVASPLRRVLLLGSVVAAVCKL
jgi:hypothetical protein